MLNQKNVSVFSVFLLKNYLAANVCYLIENSKLKKQ